ncbi:hypothetical protein [Aurantimonas marina]|uniref:hypothetical protein n=1 Tax=Aurantimonas marina TaxID=2780508 RepID=UPI001E4E77C1|nr:hypothetical protein [Aurantimonas marina]
MFDLVTSHQDESAFLVDSGDIHHRQSRSACLEPGANSSTEGLFRQDDHQHRQQAHGDRDDRHPDDWRETFAY